MVIIENMLNNAQTMGPVFWAGAAAMALGATLLIVSILTMVRRFNFKGLNFGKLLAAKRIKRDLSDTGGSNSSTSGTARKTDSGYEPTTFPLQNKGTAPAAALNQVSYDLTNRLHRAADTLDEIIHGLQKENQTTGFSHLKDDTEGVEYLFKTSVG